MPALRTTGCAQVCNMPEWCTLLMMHARAPQCACTMRPCPPLPGLNRMCLCAPDQDYATPEGRVLSRDLTHVLNTAIAYLVECRPLSLSMGNAIKALKLQVQALSSYPEV